ncbi:MAG: hypothetical protein ACW99G_19335 [Candidatus Thorarchaeota archaeon]|jgi:hypothetical protein
MSTWIRVTYLRGYAYVLRKANLFYDALLASWHRDYMFALLGIITGVLAFLALGVWLWFVAGATASIFHGNWALLIENILLAIVAFAVMRALIRLTYWLMPFNEKDAGDNGTTGE